MIRLCRTYKLKVCGTGLCGVLLYRKAFEATLQLWTNNHLSSLVYLPLKIRKLKPEQIEGRETLYWRRLLDLVLGAFVELLGDLVELLGDLVELLGDLVLLDDNSRRLLDLVLGAKSSIEPS